jgi:hypothetical protein
MSKPHGITIFKRERAAALLCEETSILLIRSQRGLATSPILLHYVREDGTASVCGLGPEFWEGLHYALDPRRPDRACSRCAHHYGEKPEDMIRAFHNWRDNILTKDLTVVTPELLDAFRQAGA